MFSRFFCLYIALIFILSTAVASFSAQLTSEELEWVHRNASQIHFAPNRTWPPAEFIDESGNYAGLVADYVAIIESQLGVKFPRIELNTWAEIVQALKTGKADWVAGIHKNDERATYLEFSDVYLIVPIVFLAREDWVDKFFAKGDDKIKVACTKSYATIDFLHEHFPRVEIVECEDDLRALLLTSLGEVDGTAVDIMTASYLQQKYGIANLAYAGETGFNYQIAMAARKEYAPLIGIFNKILRSIPAEERQKIYNRWVTIDVTKSEAFIIKRLKRILQIIFVPLLILLGLITVFAYLLRKEVKRKTADLEKANQQKAKLLDDLKKEVWEKSKIAESLEQSNRKLEDIFNAVNDGILLVDLDHLNVLDCNERAVQILGLHSFEGLKGKTLPSLKVLKCISFDTHLEEAIAKGTHKTEMRLTCNDGKTLWVELFLKKVDFHQTHNLLLVIRDITESKEYEEQLAKALEEARQSDRLKSAFLRNLSHEFRTPMNGIMGFASLLRDKFYREKYFDAFFEKIENSGHRLLYLVDEMVEISKLEAGDYSFTTQPFELLDFLNTVKNEFIPLEGSKNLSLMVKPDIACQEAVCHSDPETLKVIFKHLLRNAIKYSQQPIVELGFLKRSEEIVLFVKDYGIGIPQNRLEAVFNAFEQADPEDKSSHEGIGLGLTIARKYVQLLGGQIWLESTEGKGTTVFISLPCIGQPEAKQ